MYRNDDGKYVDVTPQSGTLRYGFGLGLVISDINDDGWPDVYVANDYSVPDYMFINQQDGTFRDEQKQRTRQISWFGMGVDIADINNDGARDITVVDMAADDHVRDKTLMAPMNPRLFWFAVNDMQYQYQYMFNSLQLNNGNGTFANVASLMGVARTEWSWAALFADFDNDGYKDYFVSNGIRRYPRDNDFRNEMAEVREANGGTVPNELRQELYEKMPQIKLPNFMYHNDGNYAFNEVAAEWGVDNPTYSNGAAYGDLDNDGDLDLVVNNMDEVASIYRNNATETNDNHFLRVELSDLTDLVGTKVEIFYGEEQQMVEYATVRGYKGAIGPVLHFGTGETSTLDRLVVTWPDKKVQVLPQVNCDQTLSISYTDAVHRDTDDVSVEPLFEEIAASDSGVDFVHTENLYDDFAREVLLPYKQSTLGPFIGTADVNGDGLQDFYIGGAADQAGCLYLQMSEGRFVKSSSQPWSQHRNCEDMGSVFFDLEGDGDLDLYVASGGNEFIQGSLTLQDRIYINDGKGGFRHAESALPAIRESTLRVRATDYDNDGDDDLLVGGRLLPGHYPSSTGSYVLRNDDGRLTDVTEEIAPGLSSAGLVNDAQWVDFDRDGDTDLVLAAEWSPIRFFENGNGRFDDVTEQLGLSSMKGFWKSIAQTDLNGDSKPDFVVGNMGLNSKFYASEKKPFKIFASDFDNSGSWDVVLSKEYNGELVPTRGRECSSQQMPFIKEKFPTYMDFATASINDILGEEALNSCLQLEITEFSSIALLSNSSGSYDVKPLPRIAQRAPVHGIVQTDVDQDGRDDVVVAGNLHSMEIETPRIDAGTGDVLLTNADGTFTRLTPIESGLFATEDVRDIALIENPTSRLILVANNNGPVQIFRQELGVKSVGARLDKN